MKLQNSRSTKKIYIYAPIIIFYLLTLYPLGRAMTYFLTAQNITLYYPLVEAPSNPEPDFSYFCTATTLLPQTNPTQTIETALRRNLLPNFNVAIPFQSDLIRLQSLQLQQSTLVIDLSKEFYSLSRTEEQTLVFSLLLNIYHNFSNISEVFITINGLSHQFLNSPLYYKTPFIIKELPQEIQKQLSPEQDIPTLLKSIVPCPVY